MILKTIKTEHTDKKTGLVLKRITTSEWEDTNHKVAVNNSLFTCEQQRESHDKDMLDARFQVHHIFFNKKRKTWNFDKMAESKAHAAKLGRLYLPFQQRSMKQWDVFDFPEAEVDFQDVATRGLSLVPYSIPMTASLDEWKKRRVDALALLSKGQELVAVFCSRHQKDLFEDIFNYEFENSRVIGVQCYGLKDSDTISNLMKIKLRNQRLQTGDAAPLLVGLNYEKVQKQFSCVSGSFAYACFGFDILSCREICMENMPVSAIQEMLSKKLEEIMRYDSLLGGFTLSAEQEFWDGVNLTRKFLENVDLTEWLTPYQAIQWANYRGQQKDLTIINEHILKTAYEENALIEYIGSEKEKWSVFWKTKMLVSTGVNP